MGELAIITIAEIDAEYRDAMSKLREKQGLSRRDYEAEWRRTYYQRSCALETFARGHRPDA